MTLFALCHWFKSSSHEEYRIPTLPPSFEGINALSFYLVGPKWLWSDQIDLALTIMIWSRPK